MRRTGGRVVASRRSTRRAATSRSEPIRTIPADFAEAIRRAISDRERLAAAGIGHAKGFTWRAVGETFLRGYEAAVP